MRNYKIMTLTVAYLIQYCCVFKDTLRLERQIIAICLEISAVVWLKQLVSKQWNHCTRCPKICIILQSDEVMS
jgi:hypothetical protein